MSYILGSETEHELRDVFRKIGAFVVELTALTKMIREQMQTDAARKPQPSPPRRPTGHPEGGHGI